MAKYRNKVLTGEVAGRLKELVRETCQAFEIRIFQALERNDHVHIWVSYPLLYHGGADDAGND